MDDSNRNVKVLSCVPPQHYNTQDKLEWLDQTAAEHNPDIFLTPQEYFGGMVIMPQKPFFTEAELLPDLEALCASHDMAMVVGVVEAEDEKNWERLWFIDPREGGLLGKITKFALPSYSLAKAGGTYQAYPEIDLRKRAVAFEMRGAKVSGMFCWEVFSDFLWFALGRAEPDIVASLIKFGPMAYPKLKGNKKTGREIESFGISSGRNVWLERLEIASIWEANCPIICSTNSWSLPSASMPICGQIRDILDRSTLWYPRKPRTKALKNFSYSHVQIDEVDVNEVRGLRSNKWDYFKLCGKFPPFQMRTFTMWTKIHRLERTLDGVDQLQSEG